MKIIEPLIEVENFNGIQIMKNIERACRTCYRSEDKITDTSYQNLLKNCINRGHESVLEHEKISIRMTCDLGVYKDLTRHRIASFSIESTRYCNYGKDKFDNELKFIRPVYYVESWKDRNYEGSAMSLEENKSAIWYRTMEEIESNYIDMSKLGCTPDEMRMLLPHSIAAEVCMTANIREWKHILSLRTTNHVHPSIQQLMIPLLLKFKEEMPEIFNVIDYNTEFPKEKYAKILMMGV
ncbi:FAD-dependent thymidylate synthase [uncultured Clostridium sp.]|uniref:FAD-dependent thymidylate synthase n=1 Tax=uncultured Clostridium sp. TaxID=59620 RepID=UPI0026EB7A0F|nr:FAD-dependent thymidylate synthase [uncultured Clostridium sp.]